MQETQLRRLGQQDPLEKGIATHSSILAWTEFHGQRSLEGRNPRGRKESDPTVLKCGGFRNIFQITAFNCHLSSIYTVRVVLFLDK